MVSSLLGLFFSRKGTGGRPGPLAVNPSLQWSRCLLLCVVSEAAGTSPSQLLHPLPWIVNSKFHHFHRTVSIPWLDWKLFRVKKHSFPSPRPCIFPIPEPFLSLVDSEFDTDGVADSLLSPREGGRGGLGAQRLSRDECYKAAPCTEKAQPSELDQTEFLSALRHPCNTGKFYTDFCLKNGNNNAYFVA